MGHSMQVKVRANADAAEVRIFANSDVWLEASAVEQLHTTAALPHIRAAVGLPDLHPGRGYPVGAAFFSTGHFYPALVGGDIGCGMALWQTPLKTHQYSAQKLEKRIGSQEGALPEALQTSAYAELNGLLQEASLPIDASLLASSLGTIGGGNHFAEVLALDHLYEAANAIQLSAKTLYLLVHSGSRGLGGAILRAHVDAFGHRGLAANSPAAAAYLQQHDLAQQFAHCNRHWIAQRFLHSLRCEGECLLDVSHNHVLAADYQGQSGYLHRKGATPSDQGIVMVPGSRGDYSYLVRPVAERQEALCSLAHGAGRKWARADCEGRLSAKFHASDLRTTRFASSVVCNDKALLFEEAPQAYKKVDSVVATLVDAGLVELIARFKPVLTYKKGAPTCC